MDTNTTEIIHKIDDLRKDMDSQFAALPNVYASKESVSFVTKELGKKVNLTWFLGILLTILGLQATFFYFMWAKIETISTNSQITREAVANIQGKLEPFDFVIE